MGKKAKVVIDTNIIISAFGWDANPEGILKLAVSNKIINFTCFEMLDELRRVVSYPKINFSEELQAEIIETVFSISSLIEINEPLNVIIDDPDDNKILECAVSADVDFIISGDKHLLGLKKYLNIEILTPESFLSKYN